MASEQDLDDIRRRIDIVDLIGHYVSLKKAGSNFKALCPFHPEKTPSMMVSPEKQIFKCFGCNEGGDIFSFIMKIENLTFPEAVQMLADRAGVQITKYTPVQKAEENKKNRLYQINSLAAKFYHTILMRHPVGAAAKKYLESRGIKDKTIRKFGLGFAPTQKGLGTFLQKRGFTQQLINEAGGPDKFFRRIIFPIYDVLGNVIALMGRVFPEGMPKYLNTAETILYHKSRTLYGLHFAKSEIKKQDSVVLVEGQMDVVASHQTGVENVVATSGTSFTSDHLYILSRYTQNFVLAFDNDEAGEATTEKIAKMIIKEGYSAKIIQMPSEFKDAGEVIEREPALWQKIISKAIPAVDWYFAKAEAPFTIKDRLSGEEKKKIANYLLPIIAMIPHAIERAHYVKKIAERLVVREEVVLQTLNKQVIKLETKEEAATREDELTSRQDEIEKRVLELFIFHPKIARDYTAKLTEEIFQATQTRIIATRLKEWYNIKKQAGGTSTDLISYLRQNLNGEEKKFLETILGADLNNISSTDSSLTKEEIITCIRHLNSIRREEQKEQFAQMIAKAEQEGDREKVKKLLGELQCFLTNKE